MRLRSLPYPEPPVAGGVPRLKPGRPPGAQPVGEKGGGWWVGGGQAAWLGTQPGAVADCWWRPGVLEAVRPSGAKKSLMPARGGAGCQPAWREGGEAQSGGGAPPAESSRARWGCGWEGCMPASACCVCKRGEREGDGTGGGKRCSTPPAMVG